MFNGCIFQYNKSSKTWTCPLHECHCCQKLVQENLQPAKRKEPVLKCVRCPSAYHQSEKCLPAGSFLIGGRNIICPKHFVARGKSLHRPIHSNNCFVCNGGGELIICDGCPAAYHSSCCDKDEKELEGNYSYAQISAVFLILQPYAKNCDQELTPLNTRQRLF